MSVLENKEKQQPDIFREVAVSIGADLSDDALDRIMGKLDLTRKLEKQPLSDVDSETKDQRDGKPAKSD